MSGLGDGAAEVVDGAVEARQDWPPLPPQVAEAVPTPYPLPLPLLLPGRQCTWAGMRW